MGIPFLNGDIAMPGAWAKRQARAIGAGLVDLLYPPRCIACAEPVAGAHGLCAGCWRETVFIAGAVCSGCGVPVPGGVDGPCEDCHAHLRPWSAARAAVLYGGPARRAILGLKHGDRLDLARPLAGWMLRAGGPVLAGADVVVPVPLHWSRLLVRRYNQSALLAARVAAAAGLAYRADALRRVRATPKQEGMSRARRLATQAGAIVAGPAGRTAMAGRVVVIVDDVMTSGATLQAATLAALAAGAAEVRVLVLARVAMGAEAGL